MKDRLVIKDGLNYYQIACAVIIIVLIGAIFGMVYEEYLSNGILYVFTGRIPLPAKNFCNPKNLPSPGVEEKAQSFPSRFFRFITCPLNLGYFSYGLVILGIVVLNYYYLQSWPFYTKILLFGILAGTGELIVGSVDNSDHKRWDYRNIPLNIRGQTSAVHMLIWGVAILFGVFLSTTILKSNGYLEIKK